MNISIYRRKAVLTLFVIAAFLMSELPLSAQSVIVYSDITGGSSVFVFPNSEKAATGKYVPTKTRRAKDQQLASARKINRQYVDLAKVAPRRARTTAVDPNKLPPSEKINLMPKEQASKLFAGVGEWYINREDSDHAEDFFRTAYTLDNSNSIAKNGLSEALALQGNGLLVKGDADGAKKKLDEALVYNPNNGVAYYGLGEVYGSQNKDDDAIASYEKALQLDRALTEIHVPLGILYYQKGEIAKADNLLTKAVALSPEDPETQFYFGLVRYSQGKDDEAALRAFRAAKKAKPDYAEAWAYTGITLIRQNKPGDAVTELLKAVELKPDYFDGWFALGTAYFTIENYPKAIEAYNQAVRFRNNSAEAQANLGDAYRLNGDFRNAEGRYNLANSLAANDKNFTEAEQADVYNKIGYVIARQCDAYSKSNTRCGWQRAVTALEKAVDKSQSQVDYANLGWAYYNAAHNDLNENRPEEGKAKLIKARDALLKAIEGNPSYVDGPLLNLAVTYRDLGDRQAAMDTLKKVAEKQPKWAFVANELGVAYFDMKSYREAAEQFRKAIDLDDKFAPAYLNLGKTEFLNGNTGEAKKAYQKLKSIGQERMANQLASYTHGAVTR